MATRWMPANSRTDRSTPAKAKTSTRGTNTIETCTDASQPAAGLPAGLPAGAPAGRSVGRGIGRGAATETCAGRGRGNVGAGRGVSTCAGRGRGVSDAQSQPARQIGAPHVFPRMGRGDIRRAYTLGRELGKGGGGVVRECLDPLTGLPVAACKTIPKTKLQRADLVEELRAEVAAMKRLSGHAHVVRLLAVYEDDEAVHVVMELCGGGDLYDLLTASTTLPEPIAAQLASQILKALSHCHRNGILHRDIKPENILLAHPVTVQDGQITMIETGDPATEAAATSGGGMVATVPMSAGYTAEDVIMQDVTYSKEGPVSSTVACAGGGSFASPCPSTSTFSTSVVSSTPSSMLMSTGSASTASSSYGGKGSRSVGWGSGSGEEDGEDEGERAEGGGNTLHIKLADFGLSVVLKTGQQAVGMHGSNVYMAPEVVCRKPYGLAIDLWGLGVILFTALSGYMPFWGNTDEELFVRILRGRPDYVSDPWPSISTEAKDLVHRLLTIDPPRRITADVALQHPWILRHCSASVPSVPLPLSEPAASSYPNTPASSALASSVNAAASVAAAPAAIPTPTSAAPVAATAAAAAAPAAAGLVAPSAIARRQPSPSRRAPSPVKRPSSPVPRTSAPATTAAGAGAAAKAPATSPRYPSKTRPATSQVAAARASAAAAARAAARGAAAAPVSSAAAAAKGGAAPSTPLLPSRTRVNVAAGRAAAASRAAMPAGKRVSAAAAEGMGMHVDMALDGNVQTQENPQQQEQQQRKQQQETQQRNHHQSNASPAHSPTFSSASSAASCPTPFTLPHAAAPPTPHHPRSTLHPHLMHSVLDAAAATPDSRPYIAAAGTRADATVAPLPAAITIRPSSASLMPPPLQLASTAAPATATSAGSMGASNAAAAFPPATAVRGYCGAAGPGDEAAVEVGASAEEEAAAAATSVHVAAPAEATASMRSAPVLPVHTTYSVPSTTATAAAAAASVPPASDHPAPHEPSTICPATTDALEAPIEPLMRSTRALRKGRTGAFRVSSVKRRDAHAATTAAASAPGAAAGGAAGGAAGAGAAAGAGGNHFGNASGAVASATSKLASLFSIGAAPAAKARKSATGAGVSGSDASGLGVQSGFFRVRPSGLSSPFTFFSPKRKIRKSQVVVNSAAAGVVTGSKQGTGAATKGNGVEVMGEADGGVEEDEEEGEYEDEEEGEEGEEEDAGCEVGEQQQQQQQQGHLESAAGLDGFNSAVLSAAAAAVLQTHLNTEGEGKEQQQHQQQQHQQQQGNCHPHPHQPWQRNGMIGSTGAASSVGTIQDFRARLSPAVTLDRTAAPEPVAVYTSTGGVLPAVSSPLVEAGLEASGRGGVVEVDGGVCEGGMSGVVEAFSILRTNSARGHSGDTKVVQHGEAGSHLARAATDNKSMLGRSNGSGRFKHL